MLVEEKKNRIYSKELKEEFDRLQSKLTIYFIYFTSIYFFINKKSWMWKKMKSIIWRTENTPACRWSEVEPRERYSCARISLQKQGSHFICYSNKSILYYRQPILCYFRVAIKIGLNAFAKNELDILKRVRNPFVVKFIESFSSPTSLAIVMEYCEVL